MTGVTGELYLFLLLAPFLGFGLIIWFIISMVLAFRENRIDPLYYSSAVILAILFIMLGNTISAEFDFKDPINYLIIGSILAVMLINFLATRKIRKNGKDSF